MHSAAEMVEFFVSEWLRETEPGRAVLAAIAFNDAIDHVVELLNAGLLKLTANADGFTGIRICNPPEPPIGRIVRKKVRRH